jgi:anti-sigma regulatory factor (Ser/Thr protein kinase)
MCGRDVLAAVSELVTNAVRHLHRRPTRTLRTDPVHLRLRHRWRTVRVEVLNPGLPFSISDVPPAGDLAEHGRGLAVVRALNADMGVDTSNGATCVWCELPY